MKGFLPVCVLLLAFAFCGRGQVNLVPNGDFEQYIHCPAGPAQLDSCLYWIYPSDILAGADYFNSCFDELNGIGVPANYCGYQVSHSGNAYCGLVIYATPPMSNYREYLEVPLKERLKSNICYNFSMFVASASNNQYRSNDISAYFSDTIIQGVPNYFPLPFTPQFNNLDSIPCDPFNWKLLKYDFIASGGEKYLIIGNFKNDSLTTVIQVNNTGYFAAYHYVDDVSVIIADLAVVIPSDTLIQQGDSIYIGGQAGIGLDEDCIWFVNGVPIDTIAGMWVKPDTTTTYVLQQDICGNVKYDTVTVTVSGVGIGEYGWGGKVKVFPNPATNTLYFSSIPSNTIAEIYNLSGKLILKSSLIKPQIDISNLAKGMYFIKLNTAQGSVVRKFVKNRE
jgi:hypothetical protein